MKRALSVTIAVVGILLSGTLLAKERHPNLNAASKGVADAEAALTAAQTANEWDLGGHAKAAKGYLDQANGEITKALAAADAR